MPGNGVFVMGMSTRNSKADHALTAVQSILKKYITEGPTIEELIAAKKYLIGNFPQSLASNNQIASVLLRQAFYKLPADYLKTYTANVEAVDLKAVREAFAALVHPDKLVEVVVGTKS